MTALPENSRPAEAGAPRQPVGDLRPCGPPSLPDRVWVHRRVEWLVGRAALPDPLDLEEDAVAALVEAGIEVPAEGPRRRLLLAEVWAALGRRVGPPSWVDEQGPVDPAGDLAGGRPVACRMLCRRGVEPDADGSVEGVLCEHPKQGGRHGRPEVGDGCAVQNGHGPLALLAGRWAVRPAAAQKGGFRCQRVKDGQEMTAAPGSGTSLLAPLAVFDQP